MRIPLIILFSLSLAGCAKDSTGANSGGLPAASVSGTWTMTLGDSLPCPDSVPERIFTVNVSGTDDDVLPAGSLTFTDTWTSPSGLGGIVYGTINVSSRLVLMHLTIQDTLSHALELKGFLDGSLVLNGLAVDPYAGYAPLLTSAGCRFNLSGTRTSP